MNSRMKTLLVFAVLLTIVGVSTGIEIALFAFAPERAMSIVPFIMAWIVVGAYGLLVVVPELCAPEGITVEEADQALDRLVEAENEQRRNMEA